MSQTFRDQDYPGLFKSADTTSIKAQRYHLQCMRWQLVLLVLGAAASPFADSSTLATLGAAICFLGALCCSGIIAVFRFDQRWYSTRAIAESVKTTTWKFIMRAQPFNTQDCCAENDFLKVLKEILSENRDVTKELCHEEAKDNAISQIMRDARSMSTEERLKYYVENRIDEQHDWYAKKAATNKSSGTRWLIAIFILNGLAILSVFFRLSVPVWSFIPTSILAIAASSSLGWLQTKRFTELSTSYALTTHEISIISAKAQNIASDEELSAYVTDAENAFSREHTQWAARRDAICQYS